ncbi:MAG: GH36-type glycosyl hydrolase domain-containing protein [Verrucomicrobiota bacterium]
MKKSDINPSDPGMCAEASHFGCFDRVSSEYVITDIDTPRDWYNYAWNEEIVALFSQCGRGEAIVQDGAGNRFHTSGNRVAYLRERATGIFWTLNGLPADLIPGARCRHGLGYSVIEQEVNGVESSFCWFVPGNAPCEIWDIRVSNRSEKEQELDLFTFMSTMFDGVYKPQIYYNANGFFDQELQTLYLSKRHAYKGGDSACVFMAVNRRVDGFDAAENAFIGHGCEHRPDALLRGSCSGSGSEMEKGCCALQTGFTLAPGDTERIIVLAGGVRYPEEIEPLRERFFAGQGVDDAYNETVKAIEDVIGGDRIQTPDRRFDAFFHPWLKRQLSLGAHWARVRHNGFRDQVQDIGALALFDQESALLELKRVLAFQYPSGYAPRTWLDGAILDKDFSDNNVWIAYAVHQFLMEQGTDEQLNITVPFNDGSSAELYEHVKRSVAFYNAEKGPHGLLKIHSGDWNDCLDRVGPEGSGESVWLSMAWYGACRRLAAIARLTGRDDDAVHAEEWADEMRDRIDAHGWDGKWYLRAYHDDGGSIGSASAARNRLFLLPQAWSVFTGVAKENRGRIAMDSVDRHLKTELGTVTVLDPSDSWNPRIGMSSTKRPGTHENGGVYLHACAFKLAADGMLKRHDNVAFALQTMLPFTDHPPRKTCEPYVFCNSYFAIPGSYRYGTAGQSWGTGAAGWFYYAFTHYVLGVRPEWNGLRIDPCLPPDWKSCVFHRRFRGTNYAIRFEQARPRGKVTGIRINDVRLNGNLIPVSGESDVDVWVSLG